MAATKTKRKSSPKAQSSKRSEQKLLIRMDTDKGLEQIAKLKEDYDWSTFLANNCSLQELVANGRTSTIRYGSHQVYYWHSETFVRKGGILYGMVSSPSSVSAFGVEVERLGSDGYDCDPAAIIIPNPHKRLLAKCEGKVLLLINADDEYDVGTLDADVTGPASTMVGVIDDPQRAAVASFNCLQRLHQKGDVVRAILSGKVQLLDFTDEEWQNLSAAEHKKLKLLKGNRTQFTARDHREFGFQIPPPAAGWSLVNERWHRSGATLFCDTATKRYYLLGEDEGTYFGCLLSKPAKTITEAMEGLVPPQARGKAYKRQGEWFMTPCEVDEVPKEHECQIFFCEPETSDGSLGCSPAAFCLPLEAEESNRHLLDTGSLRIGNDGTIYAHTPVLKHPQHDEIRMDGWCAFYKNTAVRSVSQTGVD